MTRASVQVDAPRANHRTLYTIGHSRRPIAELIGIEMAARQTGAILCAEAVWWRCHRRIVTDHLLAHGVPVIHLFSRTKQAPASLTPFAVVDERTGVSYPATAPKSRPTGRGTPRAGAALDGESVDDEQRALLWVGG